MAENGDFSSQSTGSGSAEEFDSGDPDPFESPEQPSSASSSSSASLQYPSMRSSIRNGRIQTPIFHQSSSLLTAFASRINNSDISRNHNSHRPFSGDPLQISLTPESYIDISSLPIIQNPVTQNESNVVTFLTHALHDSTLHQLSVHLASNPSYIKLLIALTHAVIHLHNKLDEEEQRMRR